MTTALPETPGPASSSRITRLVSRFTPRSASSQSLNKQYGQSPTHSDDGEDVQPPMFMSEFMKEYGNKQSPSPALPSSGSASSLSSASGRQLQKSTSHQQQLHQESSHPPLRARHSEDGSASPYKPLMSANELNSSRGHQRSATGLGSLGLSSWNKSKEALVGLTRNGSGGKDSKKSSLNGKRSSAEACDLDGIDEFAAYKSPQQSIHDLPSSSRPPLHQTNSFDTAPLSQTNHYIKSTPGPVNLAGGLNESSKRFRSAFRLKTRAQDGTTSTLRKAGRARVTDQSSPSEEGSDAHGSSMDASESDKSPEDRYHSASGSASPEDLALARGMERVQLVPNHQRQTSEERPSMDGPRPSMDTMRPIFASSRLQNRLEAASLVNPNQEEPSPPPVPARDARRPSPPYGSLFRNNRNSPTPPPSSSSASIEPVQTLAGRASFDTFRSSPTAEPVGRASSDMLRRPFDTRRDQAREDAGRRLAGTAPLHFTKSNPALKESSPTAQPRENRKSDTLKFSSENIQVSAPAAKKPNDLSFASKRDHHVYAAPRAPLLELPARQHQVSATDRVVPLRAHSPSPPEQNQFNVLPDQPPGPSQPLHPAPLAPLPAPPASQPQQQQQQQQQAPARKATHMTVNGKQYLRSALLGKGGSSRVYRVTDRDHSVFALKRVELGKGDLETYNSFCNEIELLKRLRGHDRIIQLVDAEVNEAKRTLIMILEIGEIDLNSLLQEKLGKRVSMNFVRHVWEQMLEAVKVVHDAGIVHTDLKPANFVLVKGALKLIDFGIAKAIPSDTTNIARDQQIGTANYMSPEALCDSGMGARGERLMKMGRPSDVWSLGCILYQIVYGSTPFGQLRNLPQKMIAIQNPLYQIDFPSHAVPKTREGIERPELATRVEDDLLRVMRNCLRFESKKRSTIPELLEDPFLCREGSQTIAEAPAAISPSLMASIVANTIRWSAGRRPTAHEQERFVESLVRQAQLTGQ